MAQLYDLMVMAVKQQILLSRDPKDLVFVTLNHLDAIHDYIRDPAAKANLEMTHDLLVQSYCGMTTAQLQAIRHAALNFFLDLRFVSLGRKISSDLQIRWRCIAMVIFCNSRPFSLLRMI